MTFNSRSLARLRQLSHQLPENSLQPEIPKPISKKDSHGSHKVETEQDPQKLFHSLMDISPDGNVPHHLVSRLKETERAQQVTSGHNSINRRTNSPKSIPDIPLKSDSQKEEEDNLYRSFKNLLLEEEI